MSLEPALLAAIAAAPDDDLPRLVYADWLDENGRPLRAEFIRLQIEIARKETLPRAALNLFSHLWKRQQEILDNHREELLGPLATLRDIHAAEFRRGFLERISLRLHDFLTAAEFLSSLVPIPEVRVYAAEDPLDMLASNPFTYLITELQAERRYGWTDGHDREGGALVLSSELVDAAPRLVRLSFLDLENCRLGDDAVVRVFSAPFPALQDLDLSFNGLTDAGVVALLATGVPQRLRRLVLGGNPIGDDGAVALAEALANSPVLENLNLRMTNVGQAGQAALLRALGGKVDLF